MIRHVLASAGIAAAMLVATDVYFGHAVAPVAREGERHDTRAAGFSEPPLVPVPLPPTGTPSSERPPSNLTRATEIPLVPAPREPAPPDRPASPVPDGLRTVFADDFEDGFGRWDSCQNAFLNSGCGDVGAAARALDLVDEARQGARAARFVVRPGDVPDFGGGERSEVAVREGPLLSREGDEHWYEFSLMFPEDFPNPVDGSWFIVMQWHTGSGSPELALEVSPDGELQIGGEGGEARTIGPVRRGEWVDYVLHVGFSNGDGFAAAWENGVQTVERHGRRTMGSDENYFKMGIYRGNEDRTTAVVYFDDLRVSAA